VTGQLVMADYPQVASLPAVAKCDNLKCIFTHNIFLKNAFKRTPKSNSCCRC